MIASYKAVLPLGLLFLMFFINVLVSRPLEVFQILVTVSLKVIIVILSFDTAIFSSFIMVSSGILLSELFSSFF